MFKRSWALAALLLLMFAGTAQSAPVTVQLRVEGSTSTIFEGPVTTDGHAVDGKDGTGPHPCDGTTRTTPPLNPGPGPTMTSALDDASVRAGFVWSGSWFPSFGDFLLNLIGPDAAAGPDFWETNLNYVSTPVGGCQQQVAQGDELLFAFGTGSEPLLRLAGPARVATGAIATVAVTNGETGAPVQGASVAGAATGPDGTASVTFASPGVVSLKATQAGAIRSNAVNVCVSESGTGDCGVPPAQLGVPAPASDSVAPSARIAGLRDGARYRRGPRLLRGEASDSGTGVAQVKLALRRHARGHCRWWSGRREQFVGSNCHRKFFFAIGKDASWSYLLPHALPFGRYVLDVKAFDRAGNHDDRFERGRNRVVFYVSKLGRKGIGRSARARAPAVQVMIAGMTLGRTGVERAGAQLVRASGRSCKVAAATPLAALVALLRDIGARYGVRDYGHCSRGNPKDSAQLFVTRVGTERNKKDNGWFYKVNDRAPEIGAADTSGHPLRSGDRVLWFYCVFDQGGRSCQRSLRAQPDTGAVAGEPLRVRVRGYDNLGRSVAVPGATVTLGRATAASGVGGIAQIVPVEAGHVKLAATKDGMVPSFPLAIDVT